MSTTAFKVVILLGVLVCGAFSYYNVRDDAPWFKEREGIADRFLVGMIQGRNIMCNGTQGSGEFEGICLPPRECVNKGGVRSGACSFLGSCCVLEKTCGNSTRSKLSYFVPPKQFQPDCSLTVKPMNKNVCQIRLDFERFSIAKPTQRYEIFGTNSSYQCVDDAFTVSPGGSNLGFIHLCGENAKQHIYIPVTGQNDVVLRFQLSPNRNNFSLNAVLPDWRIRIHQLECRGSGSSHPLYSTLTQMHLSHHHHHPSRGNSDYKLIAPAGCLQYYPESTGTYQSFNYNNAVGPYIGQTNYAICFRRTPDVCGIRHTAVTFDMNYNDYQYDPEEPILPVCHSTGPENQYTSNDYVQIPGGMMNNMHRELFCDQMLNSSTPVTAAVPGPLYVRVRTDAFRPRDRLELGFKFHYQLLSTGCNTQA